MNSIVEKFVPKARHGKSVFTACALSAALAGYAAAAQATEDWSGNYAGISLGLNKADVDASTITQHTVNYFNRTDHDLIKSRGDKDFKPLGLTGGIVVGHNRQSGNWVYGLEADVNLQNIDEEYNHTGVTFLTAPADTFDMSTSVISYWNASLRPRVGYVRDSSLFFVSAGPALTRVHYDFNYRDTFLTGESAHTSTDKFKLGWSGGLGYEHKLDDSWSLRADMSYMYFNNVVDEVSGLQGYADGFIHDVDLSVANVKIGIVKSF